MSTYGLILSCMIDAMEGREVATTDIPGAFLKTDYEKGELSYEHRRRSLAYLMFLKLKIGEVIINGRGCA